MPQTNFLGLSLQATLKRFAIMLKQECMVVRASISIHKYTFFDWGEKSHFSF